MTKHREKKLLDHPRDATPAKHCSVHSEQAFVNRIKRYIFARDRRRPQEPGATEIEENLTHLALGRRVAG